MILSGNEGIFYINNECIETIKPQDIGGNIHEAKRIGSVIRTKNGEVFTIEQNGKEYCKMISKVSGEDTLYCNTIR